MDYNSEDNYKKFKSVITTEMPSIPLDNGSGNIWASIKLYDEETADLFMCNLMGLSSFAYLNLTSILFVQNDYTDENDMERIFYVLYTKWCYSQDDKTAENNYRKLCIEIHQDLKKYVFSMFDYCKNHNIPLKSNTTPNDSLCWEDYDSQTMETIYEHMKAEYNDIGDWIDQIEKQDQLPKREGVMGQLQNALRIYQILIDLIQEEKYFLMCAKENKIIIEDMVKGNHLLAQYFAEDLTDQSSAITEFMKLRKSISLFLTESYSQAGVSYNKDINWQCIEFLIKMYYNNKVRIAQEEKT